jgi:membrane protease subunit HflC
VRQASEIKSASERKVAELQAEAEAEAIRLRGLADAEADRIRNDAQSRDPQFYAFLKKLEDYQRFLGDNKTLLLLSTHRELFDALFNPPAVSPPMPPKKPGGP